MDVGTHSTESTDYPEFGARGRQAAWSSSAGEARGVVRVRHRASASAIAANKVARRARGAGARADGGAAGAAAQRRQRHLLRRAADRSGRGRGRRCKRVSRDAVRGRAARDAGRASSTSSITSADEAYMRQARAPGAARRAGARRPNPLVGCVIVRGGRVLATGWHQRPAGDHAEVDALRKLGGRAPGATVVRDARAVQPHRAHAAVHRAR